MMGEPMESSKMGDRGSGPRLQRVRRRVESDSSSSALTSVVPSDSHPPPPYLSEPLPPPPYSSQASDSQNTHEAQIMPFIPTPFEYPDEDTNDFRGFFDFDQAWSTAVHEMPSAESGESRGSFGFEYHGSAYQGSLYEESGYTGTTSTGMSNGIPPERVYSLRCSSEMSSTHMHHAPHIPHAIYMPEDQEYDDRMYKLDLGAESPYLDSAYAEEFPSRVLEQPPRSSSSLVSSSSSFSSPTADCSSRSLLPSGSSGMFSTLTRHAPGPHTPHTPYILEDQEHYDRIYKLNLGAETPYLEPVYPEEFSSRALGKPPRTASSHEDSRQGCVSTSDKQPSMDSTRSEYQIKLARLACSSHLIDQLQSLGGNGGTLEVQDVEETVEASVGKRVAGIAGLAFVFLVMLR